MPPPREKGLCAGGARARIELPPAAALGNLRHDPGAAFRRGVQRSAESGLTALARLLLLLYEKSPITRLSFPRRGIRLRERAREVRQSTSA